MESERGGAEEQEEPSAKKIKISSSARNSEGATPCANEPLCAPGGCTGLLDFNLIFRRWLQFRSANVATFRMKTLACRGLVSPTERKLVCTLLGKYKVYQDASIFFPVSLASYRRFL